MLKRVSFLIATLAIVGVAAGGEKNSFNFTLPDARTGKPVTLDDSRVTVVAFIGTACPVNNAYMPTLAKLTAEYQPKGVRFIGINADRLDTPAEIAEHARKYELPFPVLKDSQNKV